MGDIVRTAPNTVMALEFAIGGDVGINRIAAVKVIGERNVEDTEFNLKRVILRQGGMWTKLGKLKEPIEIQTNGGVTGIKG
jgi:hypothetical protein